MKRVRIEKSDDLSDSSKIFLHLGDEKIHIKGFGSFTFTLNEGESFYITHQWVSSPRVHYEDIKDGDSFKVKPRLGKRFLIVFFIILIICTVTFFLLKSRWSYVPLLPFILYIITYLSVYRNKYFMLQPTQNEIVNRKGDK